MATLIDHRPKNESQEHRPHAQDAVRRLPTTDSELLKQFVCDQRHEAFTELVARHAAMVLGVCKGILRDEHEAEDVFQATFLILANKGRQIQRRHPASLAAWLHRVAYRAALRAAQTQHRKGKPLVEDVKSTELEQWLTIARQEERLLLHEELNKLPELYREAVVFCCLEGNSCKVAALQLASTPEAMQKRVDRGKQMLRLRLARRGVAASVAVLAIGATACEAASLPSLVSLTSEICTATVLRADKSIYSTNVGRIAQQGAISMKSLTPAALVIGTPILLLASMTGHGDDSTAAELPIAVTAEQLPATDRVIFVAAQSHSTSAQDAAELNEKLRIILHRQEGDAIKLYLNATRAYVNGKSISSDELQTIVRKSGLERAVISAEPHLSKVNVTGWKKTLCAAGIKEFTLTQPKPKEGKEEKIRRILGRQEGDQLKIYLDGTQGIYVKGTQISTGTLAEIIRQSGLEQAVITAGLEVLPSRVTEMEQWLLSNGVEDVEKVGTAAKELTLEELAAASREKAARGRETKLRALLARQKGDHLEVYLNDKGAYINGKSISAKDIQAIVGALGLDRAVISAEPYLAGEKVTGWEKTLRKAGVGKIELSAPTAN